MSQRKMMLSGLLLVLGLFNSVIGKPAAADQNNDYPMQSDDDYQYDDENASSKAPMESARSTTPPHLAITEYTRHAHPGEDVVLECPVTNLSANNVIMWRNDTTVLSQDKRVTNNRVSVDGNFTITIRKVNEMDSRTYTCQIHPQNLEVKANLIVSDEPQNEKQDATPTPAEPSSGNRGSISILISLLPSVLTFLLSTNSVQRI